MSRTDDSQAVDLDQGTTIQIGLTEEGSDIASIVVTSNTANITANVVSSDAAITANVQNQQPEADSHRPTQPSKPQDDQLEPQAAAVQQETPVIEAESLQKRKRCIERTYAGESLGYYF